MNGAKKKISVIAFKVSLLRIADFYSCIKSLQSYGFLSKTKTILMTLF
jgi:hypothetical protein